MLSSRLSKHKSDVKLQKTYIRLAAHSYENNHVFAFDRTSILDFQKNQFTRKILEVINIIKYKNNVNIRSDTN